MTTATPGIRTTAVAPGVRGAALAALVVGILAVVSALVLADRPAVLGAIIGSALVLVFFGFGAVTVNVVATQLPSAAMLVALLTYTLEVVLLALVFWGLTSSGATDRDIDRTWLGMSTIAGTIAWLTGQTVGALRARHPLYDLDTPTQDRPGQSSTEVGGGDDGL